LKRDIIAAIGDSCNVRMITLSLSLTQARSLSI